jgi:hypothetical protein
MNIDPARFLAGSRLTDQTIVKISALALKKLMSLGHSSAAFD